MRIILGIAAGAALGFALGYLGKCTSGMCPLTGNPWISMALGAFFGLIMTAGK